MNGGELWETYWVVAIALVGLSLCLAAPVERMNIMNKAPTSFEPIIVDLPCRQRAMIAGFLAFVLLLFGNLSVKADECRPGPFGFRPGETTDLTFNTRKNTPCTVNFTLNSYAYFKQRVTRRPRGVYAVSNYIYGTYKPPRDYAGDDYFELLLDYQRLGVGQQRNRSILRVTVKIAD